MFNMARTDVTITVVLKYFQLLQHLPVRLRARALVSILHVSVSHKMSNVPSQLTLVMTKPPGDRCDWSGRGRDPARLKSAPGTSPAAVVTVEIATRSRQQKQPRQAAGGRCFASKTTPGVQNYLHLPRILQPHKRNRRWKPGNVRF